MKFVSQLHRSRGDRHIWGKLKLFRKSGFCKVFFNLKNSSKTCFSWIHTCFDEDMEAYECAIDMVDGALETLDLTLSKRGIVGFASSFFVDDSDSFSKFSFFEFFENFSRLWALKWTPKNISKMTFLNSNWKTVQKRVF